VLCPTGQRKKGLTKGFLTLSNFKKLIDEIYPYIKYVHLSNKGEIFLNPEIFQIIKYAKVKRMLVEVDTNLNYFNKDMAEKLVNSKMDYLTVSIDGASQKTYSIYRRGGNFNRVIRHIKWINEIKKKHGSKKPFLIWQFIVFGHNEPELKKAELLANNLNMKFRVVSNDWDDAYSPPKNKRFQREFLEAKNSCGNICLQLWYSPVINWNGNMRGCCSQIKENKHFGNVFENGFFKVFYGKKISLARNSLNGKLDYIPKNIPCISCIRYKRKIFNTV
jgi:MoaA/NifB/PqqE/SkfB family radical SAM enzyme